jgi:LysR family glycine cleavage system transcriptional activator
MSSAYGRLPLNALRVFEAVATRLSFSEAAEALSVTPAAVSQQVKALEDYLQVPLLRRTGRSIELTPEGARLLPGLRQGLDVMLASLGELRQSKSTGVVHVSTLSSTLQKWLAPRLARLHEAHPDLQVEWHTAREVIDFARSDFHAAIRFGAGPYKGLHTERLIGDWFVAVATPELIKRHGLLDDYEDFSGLPLVHATDEPWSRWQQLPEGTAWTARPATIDDSATVLVAASEGLGYAVTRWSRAAQDIERGRLVLASAHIRPSKWWHWFVCPEAYLNVPKVAALRDWLRAEADAFPLPPGQSPGPAPSAPPRKRRKPKR